MERALCQTLQLRRHSHACGPANPRGGPQPQQKSNWFQLVQPTARDRPQWAPQWQPSWHLRDNVTWNSAAHGGDSGFRKKKLYEKWCFFFSWYTISRTTDVFMMDNSQHERPFPSRRLWSRWNQGQWIPSSHNTEPHRSHVTLSGTECNISDIQKKNASARGEL